MKYLSFVCLALVSGILLTCPSCGNKEEKSGAVMCNTFVTENMELKNIVSSSGIVEGTNTVSITSDLNAKITKLNVEPGSVVRKGDILCEFDKTEFQKQLNILEQKIENNSKKHEIEHNTNLRNLEYAKSQKEISLKIAQRNIDECVNKKNAASLNHDKLTAMRDDLSSRISELDKQISESEETAELVSLREYLNTEYKSVTGELEKIDSTDYDNEIAKAQDSYDKIVIECDHAIKAAEEIQSSAFNKQRRFVESLPFSRRLYSD